MNDFRVTHPLGKGEVVSSILTGSTTEAASDGHFSHPSTNVPVVSLRTEHEHCTSGGAQSVHGVLAAFAAWRSQQTNSDIVSAAERVRLSLQACAEHPGRLIFWRLLGSDVARLEAAITDASDVMGEVDG